VGGAEYDGAHFDRLRVALKALGYKPLTWTGRKNRALDVSRRDEVKPNVALRKVNAPAVVTH